MPESSRLAVLRRISALRGFRIAATDGDIGNLTDVYFDDQSWTVRHLVIDTGTWLTGRKVLVPPPAVQGMDDHGRRLMTDLTKQQVKDSPSTESARPVSRQHDSRLYEHYGYPYYWPGPYRWGPVAYPGATIAVPPAYPTPGQELPREVEEMAARERESQDPRLRSAEAVRGYGIQATDGELGHVVDFVIDDESWAIRYLIVDPESWWPGPHVVMSPEWITRVNFDEATIAVDVDQETVRRAPRFDERRLDRRYEEALHTAYGRPGYWERSSDSWRIRRSAA